MPHDLRALSITTAVIALLVFVTYRRIRRVLGRQPLQPTRMKVRMAILTAFCVALLVVPAAKLALLEASAAGAAIGFVLAFYALKHTRFETTDQGVFYTGHPYIGLGVASLLIGRIAYRMIQMNDMMGRLPAGGPPPMGPRGMSPLSGTMGNPVTTAVFFIMAAYYIAYYAGLLRNRPKDAAPPPQAA